MVQKPLIGFVGQGFVGKSYADDFEERGFEIVRYSLEPQYKENKDKIQKAEVVFICVPTPTTPDGFDYSIVDQSLSLVGPGKVALIKSTVLPGTTKRLQKLHPNIMVFAFPGFLSAGTAKKDVENPLYHTIGIPVKNKKYREAAELVVSISRPAQAFICDSNEAELIKYAHNANGYVQTVLFNLLYDLSSAVGADWEVIQNAMAADPYVSSWYIRPLHKSGRGAGGACFIKDFAALRVLYDEKLPHDEHGRRVLQALERKNVELLVDTNKDPQLVRGVYGEDPRELLEIRHREAETAKEKAASKRVSKGILRVSKKKSKRVQ